MVVLVNVIGWLMIGFMVGFVAYCVVSDLFKKGK